MPELTYNNSASALQMANLIFGNNVTVTGASYTGDPDASAIYSNGDAISPNVVPTDTGVILSTGEADRFTNVSAANPNAATNTTSPNSGPNGDPDFNTLSGLNTFDASFLEIDFIAAPGTNALTLEFVFASDEYPEFAGSIYNDMVGVWVDGTNVPLAAGNGLASVGNINDSGGINLFRSNVNDTFNTEMDGFTVSLSVVIPVTPGQEQTLKIGVADVSDNQFDSNVLIAADSVQGTLIANTDEYLLRPGDTRVVDVLENDVNDTAGVAFVTEISGTPVMPGDTVTLTTGQTVTLNADGTLSLVGNDVSEDVAFTYEIESTSGESAVGFVVIDTVPCFVAGTLIRTDKGDIPVQHLKVDDLVHTRDDGVQPIRWIGTRVVPADGKMAPVYVAPNTFGDHDALAVSPLHRLVIQNAQAELLFGSSEVLVAARDLVDGAGVCVATGGWVEYVHLLFDRHQVIWSNGLLSESFLPGPQTTGSFEQDMVEELRALFPNIDPITGKGYGPAARPALKHYEARLLVA
ncbi:MAG: choice-of-anchor L domain-containing protein [Pseudomonadota bacterium]